MASGAMYPGTFDPFTNGHDEIVRRAAHVFGRVVIAVAESPSKEPLFSLQQRIELIEASLAGLKGIEVKGYSGLTVDFAVANDLAVVVRGLRSMSDFEYEFQLAGMNRRLNTAVETVFLTPTEKDLFVSSTLVRQIASMGGDVSSFVHPAVNAALGDINK